MGGGGERGKTDGSSGRLSLGRGGFRVQIGHGRRVRDHSEEERGEEEAGDGAAAHGAHAHESFGVQAQRAALLASLEEEGEGAREEAEEGGEPRAVHCGHADGACACACTQSTDACGQEQEHPLPPKLEPGAAQLQHAQPTAAPHGQSQTDQLGKKIGPEIPRAKKLSKITIGFSQACA